jgi:hypothetical protein
MAKYPPVVVAIAVEAAKMIAIFMAGRYHK